ncbi:hypothetical protein NUW54_g9799 [Trametes sanguinea]|uniref:Uncharacterized protein n=1 Tax=Trametes sanguinea TaxID=158606 RepID=A0ACC1P6G1_9APHY|nr:hypothetical protein NUW54_g9799 [Trametes sanguinea]
MLRVCFRTGTTCADCRRDGGERVAVLGIYRAAECDPVVARHAAHAAAFARSTRARRRGSWTATSCTYRALSLARTTTLALPRKSRGPLAHSVGGPAGLDVDGQAAEHLIQRRRVFGHKQACSETAVACDPGAVYGPGPSSRRGSMRGTRSANSTPLFPAPSPSTRPSPAQRSLQGSGDMIGDTPSPVDPPMPPPVHPASYTPPVVTSNPSTTSSSPPMPSTPASPAVAAPPSQITPVTPASMLKLGRLAVSSALTSQPGAHDESSGQKQKNAIGCPALKPYPACWKCGHDADSGTFSDSDRSVSSPTSPRSPSKSSSSKKSKKRK